MTVDLYCCVQRPLCVHPPPRPALPRNCHRHVRVYDIIYTFDTAVYTRGVHIVSIHNNSAEF